MTLLNCPFGSGCCHQNS